MKLDSKDWVKLHSKFRVQRLFEFRNCIRTDRESKQALAHLFLYFKRASFGALFVERSLRLEVQLGRFHTHKRALERNASFRNFKQFEPPASYTNTACHIYVLHTYIGPKNVDLAAPQYMATMDYSRSSTFSDLAAGTSGARAFSPSEVNFFAQDELITIVPNFSIHSHPSKSLECISGVFGPFAPSRETQVPLWLALALWKRKKCDIKAPEWMSVEYLQTVLELERGEPGAFQPLPFHYVEIAHFLFTAGTQESLPKQVFQEKEGKVRDLINLIQKTRQGKILQGLSLMQEAAAVKLNNLSAMELNAVRGFFTGTLDAFTRHANMKEGLGVRREVFGDGAGEMHVDEGPSLSPARNLRRSAR